MTCDSVLRMESDVFPDTFAHMQTHSMVWQNPANSRKILKLLSFNYITQLYLVIFKTKRHTQTHTHAHTATHGKIMSIMQYGVYFFFLYLLLLNVCGWKNFFGKQIPNSVLWKNMKKLANFCNLTDNYIYYHITAQQLVQRCVYIWNVHELTMCKCSQLHLFIHFISRTYDNRHLLWNAAAETLSKCVTQNILYISVRTFRIIHIYIYNIHITITYT